MSTIADRQDKQFRVKNSDSNDATSKPNPKVEHFANTGYFYLQDLLFILRLFVP